jgi:Fe-S cluster assembly protein SufD
MMRVKQTSGIYLTNFAELERRLARDGHPWLDQLRRAAIEKYARIGLPTTKLEEWKYTNVAPIAKVRFQTASYELGRLSAEKLGHLPVASISEGCSRMVFVNGHYSQQLSSLDLPEAVKAISLAEAIKSQLPAVRAHLARHASYENHAFVALNTAFIEDGAYLEIPSGLILEKPLYLLFISIAGEQATLSHPRSLIVVGSNSQVKIIEGYVGYGSGVYFTNAVTEIIAGENAVVEHCKLQDEGEAAFHIATVQLHQERSSNLIQHSISLGGSLVRNDVSALLDGEGAECTLNGLYLTAGNQHVDNHTVIVHAKPYGTSRELYKGILGGRSTAIFNGSIIVRKGAQRTDARQVNKNLLLSEDAAINSKPQLEINADDVKCSHGTTIGQIERDSLFYLRARGISCEDARNILTYAFANEVLSQMKISQVRSKLEEILFERLSRS